MVETRTRTGVKATKPNTPTEEAPDSDAEEYQPESEDEFVEGTSGNKKRKRSGGPTKTKSPSKQARSKAKGAGEVKAISGKGTGKRRKTLSLFPTMPLDVLYEILAHLLPRDLLHVYRTNSSFKTTLEGSDATNIWRQSRQVFDAPEPPQGWNEPQWAKLLFEPKCGCGASNIQDVDWKIRKRVCSACKSGHLTGRRDKWFQKEFQGYDNEIFKYLPFTNVRPYSKATYDPNFNTRELYWNEDVHSVARKWKTLKAASHTPAGADEFEAWKQGRLAYVASCAETAATYSKWEQRYRSLKDDDATVMMKSRKAGVIQRFLGLNLGYTENDVENAFHLDPKHLKGTGNVTERVWKTLRPKLEPHVRRFKDIREERVRAPLVASRKSTLDDLYLQYLSQLKPSDLYNHPPSKFLHALPSVWQILDIASDVAVTAEHFQAVAERFPELVAGHHADLKARVASSTGAWRPQPPSLQQAEHSLQLAKNVFRCQAARNRYGGGDYYIPGTGLDQTLLGWSAVASHSLCHAAGHVDVRPGVRVNKAQCDVTLHSASSTVATTLIALTGLDPATTTISEMDSLNPRFGVTIEAIPAWWVTEYKIFTWRGALHYYADQYYRNDIPPPKFRLATPEENVTSQDHTSSLLETVRAWSCNHCQDYSTDGDLETNAVVFNHVKERHGIEAPQVPSDYLTHPRLWPALEAPCLIPLQYTTSHCYRCNHCPFGNNSLFDLNDVRDHIQQSHPSHHPARPGYNFTFVRELITSYPG